MVGFVVGVVILVVCVYTGFLVVGFVVKVVDSVVVSVGMKVVIVDSVGNV